MTFVSNCIRQTRLRIRPQLQFQQSVRQSVTAAASRATAPVPHVWPGLQKWRLAPIDEHRRLGAKGIQVGAPPWEAEAAHAQAPAAAQSLAQQAKHVLHTACPREKILLTHLYFKRLRTAAPDIGDTVPPARPARPARPALLPAPQVPTPRMTGLPAAVHNLHGLAHVELNAIDLAWDTVARFASLRLPLRFYTDFARVADDEARHLGWCLQRLHELGHAYGDLPAHDLLWEGADASRSDITARLAVVPMSQEARGLDAGPRLAAKLVGAGDARSAAIVRRIAAEEHAHVAVGVAWFKQICGALDRDGEALYREQLSAVNPDASILRAPFNHEARAAVGLPETWYNTGTWPARFKNRVTEHPHLDAPSYAGSEGGACLTPEELARVRSRLEQFFEAEEAMAA